ncbi:uncharacterized [Tachysurus ichikawai]
MKFEYITTAVERHETAYRMEEYQKVECCQLKEDQCAPLKPVSPVSLSDQLSACLRTSPGLTPPPRPKNREELTICFGDEMSLRASSTASALSSLLWEL